MRDRQLIIWVLARASGCAKFRQQLFTGQNKFRLNFVHLRVGLDKIQSGVSLFEERPSIDVLP